MVEIGWVGERCVRHWIGTLNARGWEREWAQVGPEWTGHGRHDAGKAAA
jgi:hypothetical protein